MPGENVTILHISDTQFGKNHRFAGIDLVGMPNPYDTLLSRLCDDIDKVCKENKLQPDILIHSGDLTEWGMPNEFMQAREFLEGLCKHLILPRDRVVIVPGNHDINRKA